MEFKFKNYRTFFTYLLKLEYRKLKKIAQKNKMFVIMVICPVIILLFYSILWQSNRYESTALITIEKNQQGVSSLGISSLLGVADANTSMSSITADYIGSLTMFEKLDKDIGIVKIFQNSKIDFFSRLGHEPNQKQVLRYYDSLITVYYNSTNQTIEVRMQGFSAEQSQMILQHIITNTQSFVNHLDQQLTIERINYSKKQVEISLQHLADIEHKVITFQNDKGMLDPKTEVGIIVGIMTNLQSQIVIEKASLVDKQAYFQANSIEVQQSKQRIDSLQSEFDKQKQKLLGLEGGTNDNSKLNAIVAQFETLSMQAKVAIVEYTASIQSLELAKSDSIQQKQQVVVITPPIKPDYNKYPRVWYNALILFAVLSMIFGIIQIINRIISEHKY